MSQGVNLSLSLVVDQASANALATLSNKVDFRKNQQLLDGAGAGKASKTYAAVRSIGASATDAIDLAGVLEDALGAALTFTKIKMIAIKAAAANTGDITVGGGTSACNSYFGANTDKIKIVPDGLFLLSAPSTNGYAVTASTADIINVVNTVAATVNYEIVIIGE
jgi:hypothetical protein